MIIKDLHWNAIDHQFSDEEKAEIEKAKIGRSIRPKITIIDVSILRPELLKKLQKHLGIKNE